MTKEMGDGSGLHKCFQCDSLFRPPALAHTGSLDAEPGSYPWTWQDKSGISPDRTYWHPGEVQDHFDELERDNVKHGPSDGRVTLQHELQTHLGNPDWVKGYQSQPHQPGPFVPPDAPTHYVHTNEDGGENHLHANTVQKLLNVGHSDGSQWHQSEDGVVHGYWPDGKERHYSPRTGPSKFLGSKTASGLGMPQDGDVGSLGGADVAGSVTDVNVPQTPVMVSPGGAPGAMADPNQVTTKPRQEPGGSGGAAGVGSDFADPAIGQSPDQGDDSGSDDSGSDAPPSKEARRARAARILAMMTTAQSENPGLSKREAYVLAKEAMERFPVVVTADWNGLDFGKQGPAEDGPWTHFVKTLPSHVKKYDPNAEPELDENGEPKKKKTKFEEFSDSARKVAPILEKIPLTLASKPSTLNI